MYLNLYLVDQCNIWPKKTWTDKFQTGDLRIRPLGVLSPKWKCDINTVPCKSAKPPC